MQVDAETQARIDALKTAELVAPPVPERPLLCAGMSVKAKLAAITKYIGAFEYNHTGRSYFNMKKDRGCQHISTTAKEIMREALPIQCVEAVFLGFHLTADLVEIERYPLSFKSKCGDHTYRHIVLAVCETRTGAWGALGISRRHSLQHKEVKFGSLADLVDEFNTCYTKCGHVLEKVYVGLPMPRASHSTTPVKWRVLKLSLSITQWDENRKMLDKYAKDSFWIREYFHRMGKLPEPFCSDATKRNNSSKGPDDDDESLSATPADFASPSSTRRRKSCHVKRTKKSANKTTDKPGSPLDDVPSSGCAARAEAFASGRADASPVVCYSSDEDDDQHHVKPSARGGGPSATAPAAAAPLPASSIRPATSRCPRGRPPE